METRRALTIGLEERGSAEIRERSDLPLIAHIDLPHLLLDEGNLYVERRGGPGWLPVSHVVFHSIYADDLEPLAALALWGGPCLPNAAAMMDCRLRLPCLVHALRYTRFGGVPRGFVSAGAAYAVPEGTERVAKWGNWHCGENKTRFSGVWHAQESCLIERFLPGEAVRVVLIGDRAFQIRLTGPDWKKSIHDDSAEMMEIDPELLDDARAVQAGFGLEVLGNDYIVSPDGAKYLLEVNHIPNVDRFPAIRDAYCDLVVDWLARA